MFLGLISITAMRVTVEEVGIPPDLLPYRPVNEESAVFTNVEEKKPSLWETTWPWIIKLLSPFLFLIKQVVTLVIIVNLRYLNDRKISPTAKCPACGSRELHDIYYVPAYERVIHSCKVCKADWAVATILPVDRWRVTQVAKSEPESPFEQ